MYKPFSPQQVDTVLHKLFGLRVPDLMAWDGGAAADRSQGVVAAEAGSGERSGAASSQRGAPARTRD
jgi:hypothetical protein